MSVVIVRFVGRNGTSEGAHAKKRGVEGQLTNTVDDSDPRPLHTVKHARYNVQYSRRDGTPSSVRPIRFHLL